MSSHYEHELYKLNAGSVFNQTPIPLPPKDGLAYVKINTYEDVDEPKFDPDVHLDLKKPEFVTLFPDFVKVSATEPTKKVAGEMSPFAYTSPFQVLSDEGVRVMREIVLRNEKSAVGPENSRGLKKALRGLYYLSPFVRDFQTCPELMRYFEEITGEPLIPHCLLSNVPQVNISVERNGEAPMDPWHWDSVAYTGVILLNDMNGLIGGELSLMRKDKIKALAGLVDGNLDLETTREIVNYENPGKMILAQGSEVLHQVTPVLSQHRRISMIMAYAPANAYQPPKSVLKTMRMVDRVHNLSDFEFFREKAWQCSFALKGYVHNIKYQ